MSEAPAVEVEALTQGLLSARAQSPSMGRRPSSVSKRAGGRLFCEMDGTPHHTKLAMFDPDPTSFQERGDVWSPPHPHPTSYCVAWAHPYADESLCVRGTQGMHCYDSRKQTDEGLAAATYLRRREPVAKRPFTLPGPR